MIPAGPLRSQLLHLAHQHPLAGHGGVAKTLFALKQLVWWRKMKQYVQKYVAQCDQCQRNKGSTASQGLLQPLPIPGGKWWMVTMDFITGLPVTTNGNDAILVFTDKLTKMVHFCACAIKVTALEAARLLIDNVVKLHGIPKTLISDRDPRFTAELYKAIMQSLDVKQGFSTAYHPQTDGQTERVNRCLEDYLRAYVAGQHELWEQFLPMAEFAYNNSYHTSINTTPFVLNYGVEPLSPLMLQISTVKEPHCPVASQFTADMRDAITMAQSCLKVARDKQEKFANKRRIDVKFQKGDMVMLRTSHLSVIGKKVRKLAPKYVGPFSIQDVVNPVAYRLHLPNTYQCHNVFHVSLLKRFVPTPGVPIPDPPEIFDGEPEWEVEQILSHKYETEVGQEGKELYYLIRWQGFTPEYDTWEPESCVTRAAQLVEQYWATLVHSRTPRPGAEKRSGQTKTMEKAGRTPKKR